MALVATLAALCSSAAPSFVTGRAAAAGTGLVAAYSFSEGAGTTVADVSGNGNTGTIANATWTASGKFGSALSFNGSSSLVTIPDAPELDLTTGMTLEAWVKPATNGSIWRAVAVKEQPGELVYALYSNTDTNTPAANAFVGSDQYTSGPAALALGSWSHVAATYDGTTLRLYVNGNLVSSKTLGGAIQTSSGALRIGGDSVWGEYFQGLIDEVRVYNRPLSQSELQTDMTTPVSPPAAAPVPAAAYAFDEGTGMSAGDASGNGNTGTLTGATWSAAGKHGGALSFDGASDYVTIPDSASLDLTKGMTLEAWVNPAANGATWRAVAVKEQPGELVYALYSDTNTDTPAANAFVGSDQYTSGTAALPLNAWSFLSATYDGTTLKLFVNGALVSSKALGGAILTSTGALRLGGDLVWGEWFKGLIDDVRIYGAPLTAAQQQSDMATAVGGVASSPAPPPPPPSGDTQAPSTPSGLAVSGVTQTSASLSWNASTDNVGVAGYDVYRSGTKVGTTASQSFAFSGLACGTSYSLGVVAFDAAGNRSAQASASATTSACSTPAPPPSSGTPSVFVSTGGSDSNPCTQAAPCRSFDRAYRVAQPGQIVEVAGGTYPSQELDADSSKTSTSDVVFQPAAGATVVVNSTIALGNGLGTPAASHVTFRNMRATSEIQAFTPAKDVTWDGITARNFYFRGVQNVVVHGGSYGPCLSSVDPCENNKIDLASPPEQANANITVDGALIHDFRIGNPADHFECLFLFGGTNITVKNSKFYNCEFFDIFAQYAGEGFNGLRIENNWFDQPWNGQNVQNRVSALAFSPRGYSFTDVLVRYNSFYPGTSVSWNDDGTSPAFSNFRVVGNVLGPTNGCNSSISFSYNVFVGGTCGSTDRSVSSLPYVNAAHGPNWDWHLTGGMPVDLVPGTTADQQVVGDMDGQSRPMGAGYDAGADESR